MKRHIVSLAVIIAIAVTWFVWRRHALEPPSPPVPVPAATSTLSATATATRSAAGSAPSKPVHIRRITAEDRQRLVEQITAARAVREAHGVTRTDGSSPRTPPSAEGDADDHMHDLDRLSTPVFDALQASIPFLAACYEQQAPDQAKSGGTATAHITLTNDPDIGAVIDADQILDEQQAPIDPKVDACLRSTIQTLQLPPLDAGDTVKLQYTFKLDGKN